MIIESIFTDNSYKTEHFIEMEHCSRYFSDFLPGKYRQLGAYSRKKKRLLYRVVSIEHAVCIAKTKLCTKIIVECHYNF